MKILLLGEYSNVHNTLANGLRRFGQKVTVASNGDFWKDYPRDIDLSRTPGPLGGASLLSRVYCQLPFWRGFDIVQIINPLFLELRAKRLFPIYRYLRRHNKHVVLCAMGMDYYWVNECVTNKPLRYSDFNIGDELREDECALKEREDWIGTDKQHLNQYIANDCDGIVAGLYEYYVCYHNNFAEKTSYIPLPIDSLPAGDMTTITPHRTPLKVFIGISKGRSQYKGTDIMLRAAEALQEKYPDKIELMKAEGVPFSEYEQMINDADILLDQLYSYTPSMNTLLAMSKGIVCVGGGEPENYEIIGEKTLHPIINVQPTYESVYEELEKLILHPEIIDDLKHQSIFYVSRHHDYQNVAMQYMKFYSRLK